MSEDNVLPSQYRETISALIDIAPEEGACLSMVQEVADSGPWVCMGFISPYPPVRVSPVEARYATIGLAEEFAMDEAISEVLKQTDCRQLVLVINSPGGVATSSYKIAKALRETFDPIKVYVPHVAASGGTLIAIAGNQISMGRMSHLTAIDPQVVYKGERVSAFAIVRALSRVSDYFATRRPEEAPYPWKALADKIDPILLEDHMGSVREAQRYIHSILRMADYSEEEAVEIVSSLVNTVESHGSAIGPNHAKQIGLRIVSNKEDNRILHIAKEWLGEYMMQPSEKHIIRYVLPREAEQSAKKSKSTKSKSVKGKRSQPKKSEDD